MKILITGAYGMLGSDLREVLKDNELIITGSKDLDITKENNVLQFIEDKKPEIVINAAAYTNVDNCETDYDNAYLVNAIGPKNLAVACNKLNIPLIHVSTDYVFDGSKTTPLSEEDKLGPKTAYGKTKLEGEKFVQENTKKYFILRTAWLFGINGKNFVKTMINLSKKNNVLKVVNDQKGCPTYCYDLAMAIKQLLNSDKYGIYHLTNKGELSWYDFAKKIFELSNITINVKPVTTEEFPRPAPRPHYSVLSNQKWINAGFSPMRNYEDALKDYLSLLKSSGQI
jgi:dTDP-4-dehydrorhamnose reductase